MMNNRRTILLTDGDVAEIDYPGVVTAVLLGAKHFLAQHTQRCRSGTVAACGLPLPGDRGPGSGRI